MFGLDEEEEYKEPMAMPFAPADQQPPPSAVTPEQKAQIESMIRTKYNLGGEGDYSDQARQALVDQNKSESEGPNLRAGLAAFGAGLAGRDAGAAGAQIQGMQQAQRQGRLADFDKGKMLADASGKKAVMADPMSQESKLAQELFVSMGGNPEQAKGLTAEQFERFSPALKTKFEIASKAAENAKEWDWKERMAKIASDGKKAEDPFKKLPEDNQVIIKKLADNNANKIAIKNQIDSTVKYLQDPKVSSDQKLQQARQLIKTLNSQNGADAVGAEEAKRLAGRLEMGFGGLNPMSNVPLGQIGRDIEGFTADAEITSKSIGDSISENKKVIDQNYGRVAPKAEEAPSNLVFSDANKAIKQSPPSPPKQELLKAFAAAKEGQIVDTPQGKMKKTKTGWVPVDKAMTAGLPEAE